MSQDNHTAAAAPIIEIRSLIKTYGIMPVLRKLDLEIRRGEFVALLGPNGSGKSTLLRLLGGLTRPTGGRILIGGWELPKEAAAVRAQIGMVSHKSLLYENLTAYENLLFFYRLYNLPAGQEEQHIMSLLERVGLRKRVYDLMGTFSRGMVQRLSIARALLHNPHVLLFDEPYTGLDQDAGRILDELLHAAREEHHTIIMTTHDLDRAVRLADRILILAQGKIGYDAPTIGLDTLTLIADYTDITGMAATR